MTPHNKGTRPPRFTLQVADLAVPDERKGELERSADQMADKADSLGYLDPLDEEPSVIFDPRV
jgi:hypothetical protein